MKQIILFDIDGTLFDHLVLGKLTDEKLSKDLAISIAEIEQFDREYQRKLVKESDYDAADWSTSFANQFHTDESFVKDIVFSFELMKQCYYSEVLSVLDSLKNTHNLGIYSEGFTHFQSAKIAPLIQHFKQSLVFIFRNKRISESIELLPNNAVVIDNTLDVLEKLTPRSDMRKIWINRESQETHSKFETIFSLSELLSIL